MVGECLRGARFSSGRGHEEMQSLLYCTREEGIASFGSMELS